MLSQTRRNFTKLALAALPGAGFLSAASRLAAETPGKPNSRVNGVLIGLNVPYSFASPIMSGEEVLKNCIALGLSGVELRSQPVEAFCGLTPEMAVGKKGEEKSSATSRAEAMKAFRKSVSMDKVKQFRAYYDEAGVEIGIVKIDGIFKMSDEEIDYAFTMGKALGARALSTEISHEEAELKRIGSFADKHQFMIGYHGHQTTKPEHWEAAFALAKFNGANVDLGHFVAGNNTSPVPFITKYHDRVTHVHVKDRKMNGGQNFPLGQGDTPIADVLKLIRDNKWPIQATIEFEYKVPEGSDRMAEIAKCIQFCRDALKA